MFRTSFLKELNECETLIVYNLSANIGIIFNISKRYNPTKIKFSK